MRFDEYDDRDPRVEEYIEFASADLSLKSVEQAKRELALAARSMQWMNHTFSGCDWCDECGGGAIALGKEQYIAEEAIKYLLAAGEEIELTPVCRGCFHYDATHRSVERGEYSDWETPLCEKCGDLQPDDRERKPLSEDDYKCGIWGLDTLLESGTG